MKKINKKDLEKLTKRELELFLQACRQVALIEGVDDDFFDVGDLKLGTDTYPERLASHVWRHVDWLYPPYWWDPEWRNGLPKK